jgi:hypothetical protein
VPSSCGLTARGGALCDCRATVAIRTTSSALRDPCRFDVISTPLRRLIVANTNRPGLCPVLCPPLKGRGPGGQLDERSSGQVRTVLGQVEVRKCAYTSLISPHVRTGASVAIVLSSAAPVACLRTATYARRTASHYLDIPREVSCARSRYFAFRGRVTPRSPLRAGAQIQGCTSRSRRHTASLSAMDPNELVKPCKICGSPVHEKLQPGDKRLGGVTGAPRVLRICQNSACSSNTGVDRRFNQAV